MYVNMCICVYVSVCIFIQLYSLSFLPARPEVTAMVLQWAVSTAEGHFWSLHAASTRLIILSLIISAWIIQASHFTSLSPLSTLSPISELTLPPPESTEWQNWKLKFAHVAPQQRFTSQLAGKGGVKKVVKKGSAV